MKSDMEEEDNDPSIPIILLSREQKQRIRSPWTHCLIVKVFGKSVGYHYLLTKIHQIWHPNGKFSMVDLGLDFYLVKLSLQKDFYFFISTSPWSISRHLLTIIHRWEPEFKASVAPITLMAVWVCLVELHLEFFDFAILCIIGNELGTLFRIDPHTMEGARRRFARLCIQMM
ncbi:DUF4283 domain-containing protein [Cephalotus follicularis]|uniref:DUF4283 domain-containing protein n=1 Tax=Cephalotus follicularis TaxID=3775 RepID=A0A1Q3C2N3_CEPFO|nr:DUF4283 domain-containing protein [Cephalotus follicularis]